jgi:biopolymer transport protein ExbD
MRRDPVSFNMTPMIDVVFLLIIFFLVSSHLAKQESHMELPLPVAKSSGDEDENHTNRIVVNVLEDGEYRMAGRTVNAAALKQRLTQRMANSSEPLAVKIRTSRRAAYASITPILAACAESGIDRVSFATYREARN